MLNMDFSQRVVCNTRDMPWQPSPAQGVWHKPPGYTHAPFSKQGCVIFVKLHQFAEGDSKQVTFDTHSADWRPGRQSLQVLPLHSFETQHVALVRWPAGSRFPDHTHPGGEEIYVIRGCLQDESGSYPAGTWLRNPPYSRHQPFTAEDTLIWLQTGHLSLA